MKHTASKKPLSRKRNVEVINRITDLVTSIDSKTTTIKTAVHNSKRLKCGETKELTLLDKLYDNIYEYVLIKEVKNRKLGYQAYYDQKIKTRMIKLVGFMIETIKLCVFTTPNLMIPVRLPMLIENIKSLRLPRYMIYTILILGTQLLPESRVTRFLDTKKVGKMVNYVRKVLDDRQNKFKMNHLWCLQALLEQKLSNRFSHTTRIDLMKSYSACIMLGLHKVDSGAYLGLKQSAQEQNEMEFKRRMFWMVYLNYSVQMGLVKYTIYGGFFKSANKLPKSDYEWRNGIEYKEAALMLVENKDLIRASESRRVSLDIIKIKCMIFVVHNRICAFRNRRSFMIRRDYQLDFKRYTDLSKQLNTVSKILRRHTLDTLQKLQLCENANFLIIDEATVKNLLFQLWSMRLSLINAAVHLCMTEIAFLEYFYNEPWRVQMAKMLCIDYSLEGAKILQWGCTNIPTQYMDPNIHILVCWISLALVNAAYITDHSKYREIIESRDFILMLLQKLEPKFPSRGIFQEFATQVNIAKQHFHKTNRMINPVPNIVINSAITEKDMDPWFTIGPPPSAGSGCCLLANPILSLRVLSLMYYMDYPSTPIDFGEKDNFMNLLYSFNVTLDFLHQTSMANLSDKTYHQYESFKSSDLSAAKNKSTISGNGHAVNICKILEHHSWSTQNARTFVNSLLRLLFPEHEAVGYADDYSFD